MPPAPVGLTHFGVVGTGTYDLAPPLMPVETPDMEQPQSHAVLLENFFDELRRKVPVSGE